MTDLDYSILHKLIGLKEAREKQKDSSLKEI